MNVGKITNPHFKKVYRLYDNENMRFRSGLGRYVKNVWVGVDALNLLDINNVNSYYWVSDIYNQSYAVPNYLTSRQFNVRVLVEL